MLIINEGFLNNISSCDKQTNKQYLFFYLKNSIFIFGKKMIHPIIKEIIADNKTAEAAMSFTFFIVRLKSGQTKSQSFSIAELIISKLKTIAKQIKIRIHSV